MADVDRDLLSDGERRFLRALNELGVRYLLVGMSAARNRRCSGAPSEIASMSC